LDDAVVEIGGTLRVVNWQCPVLRKWPAKDKEVWNLDGEETKGDVANDNLDK